MVNISRQFTEDIILPDGSVASSVSDVDRYIKANNLAMYDDYSKSSMQRSRYVSEKQHRDNLFAEFIKNYKRTIWDG